MTKPPADGPPRRGRPTGTVRVDEPRVPVATWLSESQHERLIRVANRQGTTVSTLIRRVLFPPPR